MRRLLASLILLTLVYALVLGSYNPWDLLGGVLISAMLLALCRQFVSDEPPAAAPGLLRRIVSFPPFVMAVIGDIIVGTWQVALISLHLRPLVQSGIVAVPIADRSSFGVAVTAHARTLSPGSFLVDVDWERRVMLFHVLDATDPHAIRENYQTFYHRYQRHVFP